MRYVLLTLAIAALLGLRWRGRDRPAYAPAARRRGGRVYAGCLRVA